jgi:DUF4097 and DUF4098 domain-containing protein YvlB
MSKALQLFLATSLSLVASHVSLAEDCKLTAERTGQLAIAGAKRIAIEARAGDLTVKGRPGVSQVAAKGKACASDQTMLDRIQIEMRLEGEVLQVTARMPDITADDAPRNAYATLDLVVDVPDQLPLELIDSSGDMEVDGVAALDVTDSSGDIDISRVAGDLAVQDSSGDVEIDEVGKNLRIRDSSGDVEVEDVHGNVEVESDGSGSLEFMRVGQNIRIGHDGSGDIRISNVKGDARVDSDGSGEVNVSDVAGSFTLGSKGSGSVDVADVGGAVNIPAEHR